MENIEHRSFLGLPSKHMTYPIHLSKVDSDVCVVVAICEGGLESLRNESITDFTDDEAYS